MAATPPSSPRHIVDSAVGLDTIASKGPNATILILELADEDSPEGWEVMGASRVRVTATIRQFIEHALYDLTFAIPEEYRNLPAVEDQRQQLRSLLEGGSGAWPFTVELRHLSQPVEDTASLEAKRFAESDDGRVSEFINPEDFKDVCQPIDEQLGLNKDSESKRCENEIVELGAPGTLRRCVIAPGNGCDDIRDSNWYGWLYDELRQAHLFTDIVCQDFPDPMDAKRSVWLPFLKDELAVGPDTILVGHSSGAEAAMRFAEESPVGGMVLVSACHSDLGDEGERASGYYPPSGGPWNWEAIRKNCGWIVQFHSRDDPLVPVQEGRVVAKALQSEYYELDGHSHFFEPFAELLDILRKKAVA